jgi:hypothetical protein
MLPYIGGLIAIALPVLMATVTKDGYSTQLGVIVAYLVIQFIDNNILVPRIVSSKVQINALISIIVVLLGGALWGISGMFLSIPFIAVLKIVFDRIDDLKPWVISTCNYLNFRITVLPDTPSSNGLKITCAFWRALPVISICRALSNKRFSASL